MMETWSGRREEILFSLDYVRQYGDYCDDQEYVDKSADYMKTDEANGPKNYEYHSDSEKHI